MPSRRPSRWLLLWFALAPAQLMAGEFEVDEHTLMLAHFNETVHKADYALGMSHFAGNGARLTDGYFGMAIDLRARGLHENFTATCEDYTPRYDGWGFHPRGNVDPAQGTFECWFQMADPKTPRMPWGQNFLHGSLARSVKHPEKDRYASFGITLNKYGLKYTFPTLARNCLMGSINFKQVSGFGKYLEPGDWHHFALCWSQGEMAIWLDGRPLATFDMTGQLGLVILSNPVRYMNMADCVVDELRISNVARYAGEFEPGWRDGGRPDYAFTGDPNVKRYDPKLMPAPVPKSVPVPTNADAVDVRLGEFSLQFNKNDGSLIHFRIGETAAQPSANGLMLHRGLEREALKARGMWNYRLRRGHARFRQLFDGKMAANHDLSVNDDVLLWRVTLTNQGEKEAWIEPLLSIPAPMAKVDKLFDGCEPRRAIHAPRHRDEYKSTLPFVAASGNGRFVGVGIDPHIDLNDIVSEWIPVGDTGVIRHGTKVALSPGETFVYDFHVVHGQSDFGTLDAIDRFHAQFPDLYRLRPDVPVYSYMPATQYYSFSKSVDMKRQGYAGGFWGHGPGHDKGDEFGTPRWWDNPDLDYDKHYKSYARRIERMWGSIWNLRQFITLYHRQSFDNFYPLRRFHACPDMTPEYIIKDLWPGHVPNEDPLCFGQYYQPIWQALLVNEYNTPIGAHLRDQTRRYLRQMKGYSPGFINDMSHAGSLYRHNDPIAQRTPGRSFSRDLGTFVRKAVGRKQRYEVINSFVDDGHRITMWSDGGAFSYTLCAYSSAIAIEGAGMYKDLTGPAEYVAPARYLLGEKPLSAMTHMNDDWTGRYLKPEQFTPETLRDYYRYCDRQLVLFCLEHGITLDPTSYMWGRQFSMETAPIMVESTVLGRKVVPAARVKAPLWVRRAGDSLDTFLVVGNSKPRPIQSDMEIVNRYFTGAPIFAAYYGGETAHTVTPTSTTIRDVTIPPRDVAAFKAVAMLEADGRAEVTTRLSGDGITLRLELDITAPGGGDLMLSTFGPVYEIDGLAVNGRPIRHARDDPIPLNRGENRIRVTYQNRSLRFTAEDWEAVDLIKDGGANFCIVADGGTEYRVSPDSTRTFALGFERGTARMLNDFLEQYDSEDGQLGNLAMAEIVAKKPDNYAGWTVILSEDPLSRPGRVRIDRKDREIRVEGATQGEMRRAMVTLMRLIDRKYPHVGRFFPLRHYKARYESGKPVPFDKWVPRAQTRDFFKKIADPLFLAKPILRKEYEGLYADGNMDFAAKYRLRFSPYIFEPTYGDDFVHGYTGPGRAESKEELLRKPG